MQRSSEVSGEKFSQLSIDVCSGDFCLSGGYNYIYRNKTESETIASCARNAFNSRVTPCSSNVWLVHKLCQGASVKRVLRNYPCGVNELTDKR